MRRSALLLAVAVILTAASAVSAAGNAPLRLTFPVRVIAGRSASVTVRATRPQPETRLRLVVVAPNQSLMDVVDATTSGGATGTPIGADVPRDGFSILMKRESATSWTAEVRFARSGRWRVVVPNWSLDGYVTPFPLVKTVQVLP